MSLQRETYRYLDSGTLYLTKEQQEASYLLIRIRVISYRPSVAFSFVRNPAQSVWGWITGMHDSCVVFEKAQRFDFELCYRDNLDSQDLAVLMCIYHQIAMTNLAIVGLAIPTALPFIFEQVSGIAPSPARELDSVRYVGLVPQVFEFHVTWLSPTSDGTECAPSVFPEPPPPPPKETAPPRDERESPPPPPPPRQEEVPDDPDRTFPPAGRLPRDFGDRNTGDLTTPTDGNCPNGATISFIGTAAGGGVGQPPIPGTSHTQVVGGAASFPLVATPLATNVNGTISRYTINGTTISGGVWYDLTVVSVECL